MTVTLGRRKFLAVATVASAAVAASLLSVERVRWRLSTAWWRAFSPTDVDIQEAFAAFVTEFQRAYPNEYKTILPLSERTKVCLLLSMDFVQQGGEESKPLTFAAIYHPYTSPCYNPFFSLATASG